MKKRNVIALALTLSLILVFVSGCSFNKKAEPTDGDANTFTGVVVEATDASMLMECDTDQFTQVWVSLVNCPAVSPQVGQRYEVTHTGEVQETYPPQVTAVSVTLLESATTTTTTTTAPVETDSLSFTGRVLEVEGDSVLMDCYDKTKFDTVWVYMGKYIDSFRVGLEYTIDYEDVVMPSLPPRITMVGFVADKVIPMEETTTFITEERAIEIASEYWKIQPGDRDPDTGFLMSIHVMGTPTEGNPQYRMALRWLVETEDGGGHFSMLDTVYIHAVTEEITVPGA